MNHLIGFAYAFAVIVLALTTATLTAIWEWIGGSICLIVGCFLIAGILTGANMGGRGRR